MLQTVIASFTAYVATNIDDLFLLLLLYTRTQDKKQKRQIFAGRYAGTGLLVAAGCAGAYGLQLLAERYLWIMGFVPIILGIKEFISKDENTDERIEYRHNMLLTTALMTIASGRDNIGVYIPLFAGWNASRLMIMLAVFALMTALWCTAGKKLADLPALQKILTQHRKIIVPAVYIGLGIYIMIK